MSSDILNSRVVAIFLGISFVLVAFLGFIPNALVSPNGIISVNYAHNMVHLMTGLAYISGVNLFIGKEDKVIIALGSLYFVVAVIGFMTEGDMLLGFIHINQTDRWLYLGLAIAILVAGFIFKPLRKVTLLN